MKARVQNKQIVFTSPITEQRFYEQNEGKYINIEVDDKESPKLRRFFEGGVVPVWYYLNPQCPWNSFREARDDLKVQFNGYSLDLSQGGKMHVPHSTKTSKKKWEAFLERIHYYFTENGFDMWYPNPDEYTAWIESAPAPDDVYPLFVTLKRMYEEKKMELKKGRPWEL